MHVCVCVEAEYWSTFAAMQKEQLRGAHVLYILDGYQDKGKRREGEEERVTEKESGLRPADKVATAHVM